MRLSERTQNIQKNNLLQKINNTSVPMEVRLKELEDYLKTLPQVEIPLKESFGYNLYVREILMPAGSFAIGHMHKYEHLSIMVSGELVMWTEYDGLVHLKGYNKVIAPAGIKRAGYVLQDVVWLTAHGMDSSMNPSDMVPSLIVSDYAEYTKFKEKEMLAIPGKPHLQLLESPDR